MVYGPHSTQTVELAIKGPDFVKKRVILWSNLDRQMLDWWQDSIWWHIFLWSNLSRRFIDEWWRALWPAAVLGVSFTTVLHWSPPEQGGSIALGLVLNAVCFYRTSVMRRTHLGDSLAAASSGWGRVTVDCLSWASTVSGHGPIVLWHRFLVQQWQRNVQEVNVGSVLLGRLRSSTTTSRLVS
jgi:hypothetical protein